MSDAVKLKNLELKAERKRFEREALRDLAFTVIKNPVALCVGLLGLNRLAYVAGAYRPIANEQPTSILGGPVWFEIGPTLPMDQENYQKINSVIIGLSAGMAMGGLEGAVGSISKLVKAAGA